MTRPGEDNFVPPDYTETPPSPTIQPETTSSSGQSSANTVFMGTRRPSGVVDSWMADIPVYTSKTQAEGQWMNLSQARRNEIDRLAKMIDPRRNGRSLYKEAVNAASLARSRGDNITPATYINQLMLDVMPPGGGVGDVAGGGRAGRAAAYSGPVQSITVQAESDINASADAIAIELLGRGATEEEKKRIVNRIRKAEQAQPQVVTPRGPGMQVTEQGLTTQGREDILRQVLSKNPDFVDYQLDTTVMDLMLEDIDRGKRVLNV